MLTPGQIMGRMGGDVSSRPEYDGLMRMKSSDIVEDDWNQMLVGGNALDAPKLAAGPSIDDAGLRPLQQQDSMLGNYQSLMSMFEPRAGNTGTTPSNDFGSLLMNRNANPSFDLRGPSGGNQTNTTNISHNAGFSPYL